MANYPSLNLSITPQANTASSPPHILQYRHQNLFDSDEIDVFGLGYRVLSVNDDPLPMILIYDRGLRAIYEKNFSYYTAIQSYSGSDLYNSADVVLFAAKEFKNQKCAEAKTLPKFAGFLEEVEKMCIKAEKKYMENPDGYGIYKLEFQPNRSHAYKYWNICMSLWLDRKAAVYITEEGDISAKGTLHEGVVQHISATHECVKLQLSVIDRNAPLVKELKWSNLSKLERFGIILEGQTSTDHITSETSSRIADLKEVVAQLEQISELK